MGRLCLSSTNHSRRIAASPVCVPPTPEEISFPAPENFCRHASLHPARGLGPRTQATLEDSSLHHQGQFVGNRESLRVCACAYGQAGMCQVTTPAPAEDICLWALGTFHT